MLLLDTDILIDILKGHSAAVTCLQLLGDLEISVPGYAAMEIIVGARDKAELRDITETLELYVVCWPTPGDCDRALSLFARVSLSHRLSPFDALIGELAKGLGVPLYTFNVKHFQHVPDLLTVQPYARK